MSGGGIGAAVDLLAGGTGVGTDGYFIAAGIVAGLGVGLLVASRWFPDRPKWREPSPAARFAVAADRPPAASGR